MNAFADQYNTPTQYLMSRDAEGCLGYGPNPRDFFAPQQPQRIATGIRDLSRLTPDLSGSSLTCSFVGN